MSELDDSQIEDIFQSFDKKKKGVLDRYEVKEFFKKVLIDLDKIAKNAVDLAEKGILRLQKSLFQSFKKTHPKSSFCLLSISETSSGKARETPRSGMVIP